jgi:hypothetical protein
MIRRNDDADRAREDAFLGELIPQVTEQLAERMAGSFNVEIGKARFEDWLALNTAKLASTPQSQVSADCTRPTIAGDGSQSSTQKKTHQGDRIGGAASSTLDSASQASRKVLRRLGGILVAVVAAAAIAGMALYISTWPSTIDGTLVTLFACLVTWLCVSARWRRVHEDLLARIASLQDDAARARVHAAQVTQATTEWNAGYKQGCSDMIKAMAAMHTGGAEVAKAEDNLG